MNDTGLMEELENKLIHDFLAGNETAFNKLIDKYQQKIYWHARRMLNDHFDADEVTQEVILVIYNKLKTFDFRSTLYTWIYRITTTRSLNYIKKRKVREFFSLDDAPERELKQNDDIVGNIDNKEKLKRLDKVLKNLPDKQREVFVLRNFEEFTYQEISEITGKSVGALKANYFHALKKVMELMKDDEQR